MLDEDTLVAMESSWSNISLSLMDLNESLMNHTRSGSQYKRTLPDFLDDAAVIERRLSAVSLHVATLTNHYVRYSQDLLRSQREASKALETTVPTDYLRRLVTSDMEVWAFIGINFTKLLWDPFVDAYQRKETAGRDFATLQDEMQTLKSIAQGVRETMESLQDLTLAVSRNDPGDVVVERRASLMHSWRRLWDLGRDQRSVGS